MNNFQFTFNRYLSLLQESHTQDLKIGDVVKFTKNVLRHPWVKSLGEENSIYLRLKDLVASEYPIVVQQIKPIHQNVGPSSSGSTIVDPTLTYVVVSEQYSSGLWRNLLEVPAVLLKKVELGNNLKPVSKKEIRPDSTVIKPVEYKPNEKPKTSVDPEYQTRAAHREGKKKETASIKPVKPIEAKYKKPVPYKKKK